MPAHSPRHTTIFASLLIGAVFFGFAGDGLRAYFTPDEMMNLYGAWFRPLAESRRPLGDLFYRVVFAGAGLDPLPYRIGCYVLLCANLVLLYAVCRKLSGSREVAALACLLGAYHAHLADIYYSTDTVYDLLCFFFYFLALLLWAGQRSRIWPWRALILAMYILALAAKEMAITLPVFLALYDLIFDPPPRGLAPAGRWTVREVRRLWPFVLVTVAFILLKTVGPWRVTGNSDYLPSFSWHVLIANWKHYAFDLFYGAIAFTGRRVVLLWILLLGLAFGLRKRDLLFAACVILIGILPVALIPERGFYAIYLTLPGWYLFLAQALVSTRDRLLPPGPAARPAVLFLLVAAILVPLHWRQKPRGKAWVAEAHDSVRNTVEPLRRYSVRRAGKVLILHDPFPKDDYILTFIFRLTFRDEEILVRRAVAGFVPPPGETYDCTFTYTNQRITFFSGN